MDYLKKQEAIKAAEENLKENLSRATEDLKDLDIKEQLILLKSLTNQTGILHEAQVMQLKYWFIGLTNASKFTIGFDPEKAKIIYKVSEIKGKPPKDIDKNLNTLTEYVKFLLGNKYSVEVEDLPCLKKKKQDSRLPKKKR